MSLEQELQYALRQLSALTEDVINPHKAHVEADGIIMDVVRNLKRGRKQDLQDLIEQILEIYGEVVIE
jgi:hypothetical protein